MATSATETVTWPWLYQPQPENSDQLKEAHKDLVEDEADLADLDFSTDDFQNTVEGCVAFIAGNVINEPAPTSDSTLEVNYKDQNVKLPDCIAKLHSVDPQVKAKDIRYVHIVSGTQEGVSCDDRVVLLSVWIAVDRGIVNIYLRLPSIKGSLMLACSVSKLLYEACNKSAVRLEKFRLVRAGPVSVAECSVEERDARDKAELEKAKKTSEEPQNDGVNGTLEADAVEKKEEAKGAMEELKPLGERKMFFTLDQESLCLFDHPLSPKAVRDFRFYKESVENAIDVIYVCNVTGQLEIEQQQTVFYISSANKDTEDKNFELLSDMLRKGTMKPKPQDIFTDLQKYVDFFQERKPKAAPQKTDNPYMSVSSDPHASNLTQARGELPKWLTNLQTGSHLQSCDEDLQVLWFQLEDELQICHRENLVPESKIESAGMDPNNPEQLRVAVEEVKEKLLNRDFTLALSHLRGTMKVYGAYLLRSIAQLDEVEILKRIFFLSE